MISVAAVNDYELVVAGLARLLAASSDRLDVRDAIVVGEPLQGPVDVALYDTYGRERHVGDALRWLVDHEEVGRVAVFTLDLNERLVADAERAGATGFISKALPGPEIADAVIAVAEGERVIAGTPTPMPASAGLDWPGQADGLSERESQVLVLAAGGLSNREIAEALYLGPETVKSYLRQVYAKLGFRNRVEAAAHVHRSTAFGHHGHTAHTGHSGNTGHTGHQGLPARGARP